jgi:hypothetical protein
MMRVVVVFAVLMLIGPAAHAQVPSVEPGSRIMVWTDSRVGPLEVVSAEGSMIEGRDGDGRTVRLDLAHARRVDVRRQRSHGEGAARGLLHGGLVGIGSGALSGLAINDDFFGDTAFDRALLGAGVFGAAGVLLGLVGGALTPGERWERVALPAELDVRTRASRVELALTHRF